MKIIFLTRSYPTVAIGGLPIICQSLCEGLARHGYDITVLTMSHPDGRGSETVNGVKVEYLKCPPLRYTQEWTEEAIKRTGELKPDLIYSESGAGNNVVDRFRVPSLIRLHGFSFEELLTHVKLFAYGIKSSFNNTDMNYLNAKLQQFYIDKDIIHQYDCVIGLTQGNIRNIKYFLQPNRVELIPNGIDTDMFRYLPGEEKKFDIVYVGHLITEKGARLLIDTAKEMKCSLLTIGALKEKFDLSDVRHIDTVPNKDMPALYNSARCFVNPTYHYTGFDTTIMEASCCGVPTIVSDGENTESAFGISGIFPFKRGDRESLKSVIRQVLDVDWNNEKISAGAKKVFDNNLMVDRHIKLFDELLNGHSHQGCPGMPKQLNETVR